tara:strand:+ start:301 stop:1677 length:1377 start_codon:yes stop_codon:yes gene_type:complete
MANIDIASLFSDIVPDPAQQQRERTLQQNDAVNQANLVGKLGGMAAYYAPERSRALQQSATGLLGIDTRTESQKAMEQLKDAKIDLSSREGLIKAANIYQNIDPIKAAQLRTQAAALKTEEDKAARVKVEQQQDDTIFALDVAEATDTLAQRGSVREALPEIAKGFEERGYNDIASQVQSGALSVPDANELADARTNIENTDEWARMNDTTIFRRSDGETINTGEIPPEMIMTLGEGDTKRLVGINQDGSVGFNVSAASLLSGEDTASDAVPAANPYYNEVATSFNAINQNISTAEQLIADYPRSTGLGGNILQAVTANIPVAREIAMQPRIDLQNQIDSIISNIGFDRLQKMRDESKTGGALGNVSNIELGLLQATIASLKVEQDPELLLMNLQKVRQHYENLMKAEMGLSVEVDLTNPAYAGQVQQLDGVIYVKDPDSPTGWSKPKDANSLTIKKL